MAREVVTKMWDDFDRTLEADEAIDITLEGWTYTVDMTAENAAEFRSIIEPYLEAAHEKVRSRIEIIKRPVSHHGTGQKVQATSPTGETTEDRRKIRKWAVSNGYSVQDRGIVSNEIRHAYAIATGKRVKANRSSDEIRAESRELAEVVTSTDVHGVTPEMRAWARKKGYPVRRGYVTKEHREQFQAEQATTNGVHA
jgi:hypothetical protein